MSHIACRVDVIDAVTESETLQLLSNFAVYYASKYLVAREEAKITGKVHFHVYMLLRSETKYETLRRQWKRKFIKWDGRKQERAIAECKKPVSYLSYITKDGDVRLIKGIDLSEIVEWSEPKSYGTGMIGKLIAYAKENNEDFDDERSAFKICIKYYGENDKPIDYYRVRNYARLLCYKGDPESALEDAMIWYDAQRN